MNKLYLIIWIIVFFSLLFVVFGPVIRHRYIKLKRDTVHFYDSNIRRNFVQTEY